MTNKTKKAKHYGFFLLGGLDRNSAHPSVIDMFPSDVVVSGPSGGAEGQPAPLDRSGSIVVTVSIPEDPTQSSDDEEDNSKRTYRA